MTAESSKPFADIRDDYAFFEKHATEAGEDVRACLPLLKPYLQGSAPIRLLDFGCGSGRFSSRLHSTIFLPPTRLSITLVEPDEVFRRQAQLAMLDFTAHPIQAHAALPAGFREAFEVVLANHVFYYVPDLEGVVRQILTALSSPGLFATTLAGRDNVLIQFWLKGFALLGRPLPFHVAEDLEAALGRLGQAFEAKGVTYTLTFPDTEENRGKILRFLFGEHFAALPRQAALDFFNPYVESGKVVIRTGHRQYVVRK
jgi:SAM-dependent methyltransferase